MNLLEFLSELEKNNISGHQKYRAMKDFLKAKAWGKGVPLIGSFELTSRCNFDCKMCYVHMSGKPKELSTLQWKNIFDEACEGGMLYAALTGGECLVRDDFKELYLHLINKGVMVEILTNGELLNTQTVEWLKEFKPELIQLSVYGSNDDEYESVTGKRAFQKIDEVISDVQKAGIMLRLVITPNKQSLNDFPELYRYVRSKNAEFAVNTSLRAARRETGRDISAFDLSLDDIISICRNRCEIDGQTITLTCDEDSPQNAISPKGITCSAGRCMFFVRYDGVMTPCPNLELGDVSLLEKPFADVWSVVNQACASFCNPPECLSCKYIDACKRCPAEHFDAFKIDGKCNINVCDYTKRMISEGLIILQSDNDDKNIIL